MPSPELQRLHRLADLDVKIHTARTRAAALDGGRAKLATLREIKGRLDAAEGAASRAEAAVTDARLEEAGVREKAAAVEKDLYSGKITAPREVEDRSKQVASLKAQADRLADTLPDLRFAASPLREEADAIKAEFEAARREAQVEVKRQTAVAEKLRGALEEMEPKREPMTAGIPSGLLAKYDGIRSRHKGIGMADVSDSFSCGACGASVPERVRDALLADRVATCDNCHRILYYELAI